MRRIGREAEAGNNCIERGVEWPDIAPADARRRDKASGWRQFPCCYCRGDLRASQIFERLKSWLKARRNGPERVIAVIRGIAADVEFVLAIELICVIKCFADPVIVGACEELAERACTIGLVGDKILARSIDPRFDKA